MWLLILLGLKLIRVGKRGLRPQCIAYFSLDFLHIYVDNTVEPLNKDHLWASSQYKDSLFWYRNSHYKDAMFFESAYLYNDNGNLYAGKTASLYWDGSPDALGCEMVSHQRKSDNLQRLCWRNETISVFVVRLSQSLLSRWVSARKM